MLFRSILCFPVTICGAVLMAYPCLVRDMIKAIKEETNKKVTVKHRIGIDGKGILDESFEKTLFESYEDLKNFVDIIMEAKPHRLVVHARIAILAGLSPKENREIPPISYDEFLDDVINDYERFVKNRYTPTDNIKAKIAARNQSLVTRGVNAIKQAGEYIWHELRRDADLSCKDKFAT